MLLEYLPIFIFLVFALIFATIMLGIGFTFGPHNPDIEKNSPYECRFEAFEETVVNLPEVVDCCVVTGQSADYLLKAVVRDMAHYEQFLLGKLTRIEGVTGVHSSFELRRVVTRTAVSVPED